MKFKALCRCMGSKKMFRWIPFFFMVSMGAYAQVSPRPIMTLCVQPQAVAQYAEMERVEPAMMGMDSTGEAWLVFANEEGSWMLGYRSEGLFCVVAEGKEWKTVK